MGPVPPDGGRAGLLRRERQAPVPARPGARQGPGPGDGLLDLRPGRPVRPDLPGLLLHGHGPGRGGHDRHRRRRPRHRQHHGHVHPRALPRDRGDESGRSRGRGHPPDLFLRVGGHRSDGRRGRLRPRLGDEPPHQPRRQHLHGPPRDAAHRLLRLPARDLPGGHRLLAPGQPRLGHLPGPPGRAGLIRSSPSATIEPRASPPPRCAGFMPPVLSGDTPRLSLKEKQARHPGFGICYNGPTDENRLTRRTRREHEEIDTRDRRFGADRPRLLRRGADADDGRNRRPGSSIERS
ncbi:MAG: hypothetical protein MZV64_43705 [Ignavibacteriales bacterium]|nr:hypothetical protein [Ignavibacteriales bacterium]